MRVTISHSKSQQEIAASVDKAIDEVFKGLAIGPVQIENSQKSWNGNLMNFSLVAKAGFLVSPIRGTVLVTDKDVTIDADLGLIGKLVGDDKAQSVLESKIKGYLT